MLLFISITRRNLDLSKLKTLNLTKLKVFDFDKLSVSQMMISVEKLVGKGKKCWSPAFFPFPTMFSKALFVFFGVVKLGIVWLKIRFGFLKKLSIWKCLIFCCLMKTKKEEIKIVITVLVAFVEGNATIS